MSPQISRLKHFFLREYPVLISILLLCIIAIPRILYTDIWIDESSSLESTKEGIIQAYRLAWVWELQAPVYYTILAAWRLISDHFIFSRLLSLLFAIGAMLMFDRILRQHSRDKFFRLLFLLFVASNFTFVYAVTNIRYYTLTILLGLILIHQFPKIYMQDQNPAIKRRIVFSLVTTLAVFTHYYMGMMPLALGMVLLYRKGFRSFFAYVLDMIFPVLMIAISFSYISFQFESYANFVKPAFSVLNMLEFITMRAENFLFNFQYFHENVWIRYAIRGLFLAIAVVALIQRRKMAGKPLDFTIMLATVLLFVSGLYVIMHTDFIKFWHILSVFVIIVLLLFYTLNEFSQKWRIGLLLVLLTLNLTAQLLYFPIEDSRQQICRYIEQIENPGEPVFIYPNEDCHDFTPHYNGINDIVAIPNEVDLSRGYGIKNWVVRDEEQLDSLFKIHLSGGRHKFHLVRHKDFYEMYGVPFQVELLYDYLNEKHTMISLDTIGIYTLATFEI